MPSITQSTHVVERPDDAALVARSIVEPELFAGLYERHAAAIFRFAAIRVGREAAEDIVADTFATAFDRRTRFDLTAESARPWLYGIAANQLKKHADAERRWLQRAAASGRDRSQYDDHGSEDRVDAARMAADLAAALLTLSPGERDAVVLSTLEDLTMEELARALGIRAGAAKTRLSRGRARMRALLDPNEEDKP